MTIVATDRATGLSEQLTGRNEISRMCERLAKFFDTPPDRIYAQLCSGAELVTVGYVYRRID